MGSINPRWLFGISEPSTVSPFLGTSSFLLSLSAFKDETMWLWLFLVNVLAERPTLQVWEIDRFETGKVNKNEQELRYTFFFASVFNFNHS